MNATQSMNANTCAAQAGQSDRCAGKGTNFAAYHGGSLADWANHTLDFPGVGLVPGKHFVKDILGLTGCEISINSMPPGMSMPFAHQHQQNEEVYLFVQGAGQMQVDDAVIDVKEGTMVRVAPGGLRTWRNNSAQPLVYIVIQVKEGSLVQYSKEDGIRSDAAVVWPN